MILITILLGLVVASWFGSIYLFSYPERPFNYNLLQRMKKVEKLQAWNAGNAPKGKFYSPRGIFQDFDRLSDDNLATKSNLLKRIYLTNYKNLDERPVYLQGRFRVYQVRPLVETDVFPSGLVVRAQAIEQQEGRDVEFPNTIMEMVFPTNGPAQAAFEINDILSLDATGDRKNYRSYASVVHMQRLPEQKMIFTTVPLLYGTYEFNKDQGLALSLSPPTMLNMNGRWPLTDEGIGVQGFPKQEGATSVVLEAATKNAPVQ
jgi:hypothetical protein